MKLLFLGMLLALGPSAWATTANEPVTVPEPASMAVLAAGAGALLIARARRK
jgi:hypothetical protein